MDYIFYPETCELVRLHHGRPDGDLETAPELVARDYLCRLHAALTPEQWKSVVAGKSPCDHVDGNQILIDAMTQCGLGMMTEWDDGIPDSVHALLNRIDAIVISAWRSAR